MGCCKGRLSFWCRRSRFRNQIPHNFAAISCVRPTPPTIFSWNSRPCLALGSPSCCPHARCSEFVVEFCRSGVALCSGIEKRKSLLTHLEVCQRKFLDYGLWICLETYLEVLAEIVVVMWVVRKSSKRFVGRLSEYSPRDGHNTSETSYKRQARG
jgi:hypothetical protein